MFESLSLNRADLQIEKKRERGRGYDYRPNRERYTDRGEKRAVFGVLLLLGFESKVINF